MKWHFKNREWYELQGYDFTHYRDSFTVKAEHLIHGSEEKVKVLCDYCNEVIVKTYKALLTGRLTTLIEKDSCNNCKGQKQKEGLIQHHGVDCILKLPSVKEKAVTSYVERYGVENPFASDEIKQKIKETNLEKFNVENPMQSDTVKEKVRKTTLKKYGVEHYTQTQEYRDRYEETCLEKYGVKNVFQNDDIKEKIKQTCLEKYGVEHPMQFKEIRNKVISTNIEKYGGIAPVFSNEIKEKIKKSNLIRHGVEHTFLSPKIRAKAKATIISRYGVEHAGQIPSVIEKRNITMSRNGTVPTSSQQLEIFNMLQQKGYNVVLNSPLSKVILDIALFHDDIKIDIEYDAAYFHKDQKYDRRRDEYLKQHGWKVLRVKSGHHIPTIDELEYSIDKLLTTDRKFTEIVLKDWNL